MYPHIRDIREDRDKLQSEIADYLGVTVTAYGKYETGQNKIPVCRLIALAQYYGVSVDFLLGETRSLTRHPAASERREPRLREIRKEWGFNQTEIAERLNMSQMGYPKYETGRCGVPTTILIKLSRIYGVSIDYLLGITDVEKRYE